MISRDELAVEILICREKLSSLAKTAPTLRREHLKECLRRAQHKEDEERAACILRILHTERNRARWSRVNFSAKKPRGRDVISVKVKLPDETVEVIRTKKEVFETVSSHLAERFRLAFTAPICSGKLFDDIGFLGDTEAVEKILLGTYVFPPNCDPATRLLLEEAHFTFA